MDLSIQRKVKKSAKGRGKGGRLRPRAKPKGRPKKQGVPEPTIIYKKWPVFAPHKMLSALHAANALHLVTLVIENCFFGG